MTVSTTKAEQVHTGNDAATSFPTNFKVLEAADLTVQLRIIATGVETTLQNGVDYTVSNLGDDAGATVNYPITGDPLASTEQLILARESTFTQPDSIRNQTGFFASILEDGYDRVVMMAQENRARVERTLQVAIGTNLDPRLPTLPGDHSIVTSPDGTKFIRGPSTSEIAQAASAALNAWPNKRDVAAFFNGTETYTAGTIIGTRAEGFAYRAVDTATATTVANAGGQAFEVLPGSDGYNVKAFGAAGDGVADDTAAIQAAISATDASASVVTGGMVYLPRGRYNITDTLSVTTSLGTLASVTIFGEGIHNTVIDVQTMAGTAAIYFEDSTYCALKDLQLLGNFKCSAGLQVNNGSHIWLERVFSQNFINDCFKIERCFMTTLSGCRAKGGDSTITGFNFASGYNTSLNVINCYALDMNAVGQGYDIKDMSYSVFSACAADRPGRHGYRVRNTSGVVFNGCGAEISQRAAFSFSASAALDSASIIKGTRAIINGGTLVSSSQIAAGYGAISANQEDTSIIDVTINDLTTLTTNGNSTQTFGAHSDNNLRLYNCNLDSSPKGTGVTLDPVKAFRAKDVNIATANTPILSLADVFQRTDTYSGLLHIIATFGEYSDAIGKNSASYLIHVLKGNGVAAAVEVSKAGLTTGGSSSHPSFTWSLDDTSNQLEASPVGSTSNDFSFYITQVGGLGLGAL